MMFLLNQASGASKVTDHVCSRVLSVATERRARSQLLKYSKHDIIIHSYDI